MTETLKRELLRLVDKLPETDPTTTAYHVLLHSVEALDGIGSTIDDIVHLADEDPKDPPFPQILREIKKTEVEPVRPEDVPESPILAIVEAEIEKAAKTAATTAPKADEVADTPAPPAEPPKVTYNAAQVRKALVDARNRGVDVRAVLKQFAADNFQCLPEAKYDAVMAALEVV